MYDVYQKCTWKWSCWKNRLFRVAEDMDIHGYIHVWISDLGHAVDVSTDVWHQCLISDTGIRINDFTICVCIGDADILLLLRMFYAFLFFLCSSCSSFPPNLRLLLLSGNERDNWNFNAMRRMVSIRGRFDYFRMSLIWSKSTKLRCPLLLQLACVLAIHYRQISGWDGWRATPWSNLHPTMRCQCS